MGTFEATLAQKRLLTSSGVDRRLRAIEDYRFQVPKGVKTVNGIQPDDHGNASVATGIKVGGTTINGTVTLAAGSDITVTTSGTTVTIASDATLVAIEYAIALGGSI